VGCKVVRVYATCVENMKRNEIEIESLRRIFRETQTLGGAVCVCVCVCERERERERCAVCVCLRESASAFHVCACVFLRKCVIYVHFETHSLAYTK